MSVAILNDISRCAGCGACAVACKEINELPGPVSQKLDAYTWTRVDAHDGAFVRRMCMHCQEPACASVCPVAALHKTPEGPVAYDSGKCMGCRYCIVACPFEMPKFQWDKQLPLMQKCIMCYEKRVKHGQKPACTQVCPTGATVFGERDVLIAEARRRLKAEPRRYVNHIYGAREAGGTSVLYLSHVPFEKLGFPTDVLPDPYPKLTWAILKHVPHVVGIGGVFLTSVAWVVNRRIEMGRLAAAEARAGSGAEEGSER